MKGFSSLATKIGMLLTALLAGIFIFISSAALLFNVSLFDTQLHKSLLNKYEIYGKLEKLASDSIAGYLKGMRASSPEFSSQEKELVSMTEKAVTPGMIRMNADNVTDGLIKYFKGETRFLPDIYLNGSGEQPSCKTINSKAAPDQSPSLEKSFDKIGSINLSVILMYLNRDDISEKLSIIRLLEFIISGLPFIALPAAAMMLLLGGFLSGGWKRFVKWLRCFLIGMGSYFILAGSAITIFSYLVLPRYAVTLSQSSAGDIIVKYLQSLLFRPLSLLLGAGCVIIIIWAVLRKGPSTVGSGVASDVTSDATSGTASDVTSDAASDTASDVSTSFDTACSPKASAAGLQRILSSGPVRATIFCMLMLTAIVVLVLNTAALKDEFHERDLSVALERIGGYDISTRVIAARDEAVYTVEVRVQDKKSGQPIYGAGFNIDRLKDGVDTGGVIRSVSDADGIARLSPGKGTYRLSFDPGGLPAGYSMPAPFVFQADTAGTTVVTVNLEKLEEKRPGTVEIQLLGGDNLPVGSVELEIDELQPFADSPGRYYSFSNSEGIAAFRLNEGAYTVSFSPSGFPTGYQLPQSFTINVLSDSASRYTLKLVPKAPASGSRTKGAKSSSK